VCRFGSYFGSVVPGLSATSDQAALIAGVSLALKTGVLVYALFKLYMALRRKMREMRIAGAGGPAAAAVPQRSEGLATLPSSAVEIL
jgi:hypothetical protein